MRYIADAARNETSTPPAPRRAARTEPFAARTRPVARRPARTEAGLDGVPPCGGYNAVRGGVPQDGACGRVGGYDALRRGYEPGA